MDLGEWIERLPLHLRVRVWLLRLRILVLYRWRRAQLGVRFPVMAEPDRRGPLPPIDTGGGLYRPAFGSQFSDPSESHTSPHSEGSNCTMASAGMAGAFHTTGKTVRRGGDMRHHQGDLDGGTDLYDAADAWAAYGMSLSIRSGQGWGAVEDCLEAGRGVILQGTGGLAGCGNYTGGHAIYVNPERSGTRWLKGDPECSAWEWCEASALKGFAQRLSSGIMFAVTSAHPASTPPPQPDPCPDCPDCPECPPPPDPRPLIAQGAALAVQAAGDRAVQAWVDWLSAGAPEPADHWDVGAWVLDGPAIGRRSLGDILAAGPCPEVQDARWGRGPIPDPVASATTALEEAATWSESGWAAALWDAA